VGSKPSRKPARSLARWLSCRAWRMHVSVYAGTCFFLSACELRAAGRARIVWRVVAAGFAQDLLRRAGLIMRRACMRVEGVYTGSMALMDSTRV
jgi:hypothetical protein